MGLRSVGWGLAWDRSAAAGRRALGTRRLRGGKRVRAKRQVVWIRHLTGASLLIGMEDIGGTPDTLFPLTPAAFCRRWTGSAGGGADHQDIITTGAMWEGLRAFHAAVLACELFNAPLAAADELVVVEEKAERGYQRIRRNALTDLAAVVTGAPPLLVDIDTIRCWRRVRWSGTSSGIERDTSRRRPRPRTASRENAARNLPRVATSLSQGGAQDTRWTRDSTPLVAFLEKGHRAVALLPSAHRRVRSLHSFEGTHVRVDAEVAGRLDGVAYTLYHRFPTSR